MLPFVRFEQGGNGSIRANVFTFPPAFILSAVKYFLSVIGQHQFVCEWSVVKEVIKLTGS